MPAKQSASSLLMVRPRTFGFDKETAESNVFQHQSTLSPHEIRQRANAEFEAAVDQLRDTGIEIIVFDDPEQTDKPDAVFPNNWLSMWPDGHVFLYPMATESRRKERSNAALEQLKQRFRLHKVTDLSSSEADGRFLESTGVMIFDHIAKVVYGCRSLRCDEILFREHADALGYQAVIFDAFDRDNYPIYHTNVLMGVQTTTAVVCLDAITDTLRKEAVVHQLTTTGHEIIDISHEQMNAFCGNVLEITNKEGECFLAMSQHAYDAFTQEQRERLSRDKTLLPIAIPTIETIGGGSVRCMLAEIFLPHR